MFGFSLPQCIAGLTLLTSGSLVGLLAIWVALGRPHWFLRVTAWAGVVLSLLLIPAFEPVLLFSIQTVVAVLVLAVARAWLASRRDVAADGEPGIRPSSGWRPQFHLRDLLLLTVLVAVAAAVGVAAPRDMWKSWDSLAGGRYVPPLINVGQVTPGEGWTAFGLLGLGMGISTAAAAWIGLSRRRWWLRLGGLLLLPTSALMAVWLVLLRASGRLPCDHNGSRRSLGRHLARLALGLISLAILAPPVATFSVLISPAPEPPQIVLPNPNGYDDLRRAAKAFASVKVPKSEWGTRDPSSTFYDAFGNVLDTARIGLDRPCVVPLEDTMAEDDVLDAVRVLFDRPSLAPLRYTNAEIEEIACIVRSDWQTLRTVFRIEALVAGQSGRPADTAAVYLDELRLARAVSRGGMLNDWLVGLSIEGDAIEDMVGLHEELDGQQCRKMILALQRIDADRERPDEVVDREILWERVSLANGHWVHHWLWTIASLGSDSRPMYRDLDNHNHARFQMLLCALALRAYRLDHGEVPAALADLVPEYLPEVPVDPFGGKPLVYRPEGEKYTLYSVGPDGCDNGGNAGQPGDNEFSPGTDILLDPPAAAPNDGDDAGAER